MSTKAQQDALIESNIRENPVKITKTKHAEVEQSLSDEMFNYVYDNAGNQTVTTAVEQFLYTARFRKTGNKVVLTGEFENVSGNGIVPGAVIFRLKAGELFPVANETSVGMAAKFSNGNAVRVKIVGDAMRCVDLVTFHDGKYDFSITYTVAD